MAKLDRFKVNDEETITNRVIRAKVQPIDQRDIDQLTAFYNSKEPPTSEQQLQQIREISGVLRIISETTNLLVKFLAELGSAATLKGDLKEP